MTDNVQTLEGALPKNPNVGNSTTPVPCTLDRVVLPPPFYQDEHVTIYQGDCGRLLPLCGKFDVCITDPPYNTGYDYGAEAEDNRTLDAWMDWMRPIFTAMREQASTTLISTGHWMLPRYAMMEPWRWLLCWWKPAAMGRSPVGFCNWEPVAMWGKAGKNAVDVFKAGITPNGETGSHPCPKPLEWASGQLAMFPEAKTVVDPFMGSGTVLRAAKDRGLRAVGIEQNAEFCEIAARRMRQGVLAL